MVGHAILVLAGLGVKMFTYASSFIIKVLLWVTRGSCYWQDRWIREERNVTNKEFLRNYLGRNEVEQLKFLQESLPIASLGKLNTKWEQFRLLAVMEVANNGSAFARHFLEGVVNPLLAGKLSLARPVDRLVELLSIADVWRTNAVAEIWSFVLTAVNENETSENCSKVNKLLKV